MGWPRTVTRRRAPTASRAPQCLASQITEMVIPTTGRHLQRLVVPTECDPAEFNWALVADRVPLQTAPFQMLNLNTGAGTQIWYTFTPKQVCTPTAPVGAQCPPPPPPRVGDEHERDLVEVKGIAVWILNHLVDATRHRWRNGNGGP